MKTISMIILLLGAGMVLYELLSGTARLRGGGVYRRGDEPGKYWFAVALKAVVTLAVFYILRYW
jgi:hypothetical protein